MVFAVTIRVRRIYGNGFHGMVCFPIVGRVEHFRVGQAFQPDIGP